VQYSTANDDAIAGTDYTSQGGTLTFQPGETLQWINVAVTGDNVTELDESFFVDLGNPTNATILDGQGVGTIGDDEDFLSQLSIEDVVVSGESGTAVFVVAHTGTAFSSAHVNYSIASGTASAASDYTASSGGSLVIGPGDTETISVPITSDTIYESDEYFIVTITSSDTTVDDGTAIGLIRDNDPAPSLSIGNATATEGNSGTTNAVFTVSRSGASVLPLTVQYATANSSAQAGSDYLPVGGVLSFAAGENSKQITVPVIGDTVVESNEFFVLRLTNPVNATISDSEGQGTINNDDVPQFSISDATVVEFDYGTAEAVFTVTLSAASNLTTSVQYLMQNGSATSSADYLSIPGVLVFGPGQTSGTISVSVIGDTALEANETFFVTLANASTATIADSLGVGTIVDNDGGGALLAGAAGPALAPAMLSGTELTPILSGAVAQWSEALGNSDSRLLALDGMSIVIADLDGAAVGLAQGDMVTIDVNAAGHGWFIDVSPMQSSEFSVRLDRNVFGAARSSEAFGRMDLLTVLLHEIGHVLGFGHDDAARYAVMHEELEAGARYALAESKPGPKAGVAGARISWDARVDWDADYAHWQVPGKHGPVPNFAGFRVRF
jgi:hypothetical protein